MQSRCLSHQLLITSLSFIHVRFFPHKFFSHTSSSPCEFISHTSLSPCEFISTWVYLYMSFSPCEFISTWLLTHASLFPWEFFPHEFISMQVFPTWVYLRASFYPCEFISTRVVYSHVSFFPRCSFPICLKSIYIQPDPSQSCLLYVAN